MTSSQIGIIISIVMYLTAMLLIGIWASRRTKNVGDFYLGGRKLGPFVTAMSAEASDMSSYLLMGVPGLAYFSGVADAGWTALGLIAGTYLNWLFVAKRLRLYSAHINAITIPDYFRKRFHDERNVLITISAVAIIIFFVPYTASGFAACGKLFESLFGMNYQAAMVISAIVIVGYTATGGFLAASQTDFIQSIVMTAALFMVLGYSLFQVGGWDGFISHASSLDGFLNFSETYNNVTQSANTYGIFNKITMFCWGLGYFGMPHILLRFMAIDKPEKLKLSRRVASVWVVFSLAIAVFIGLVGRAMTLSDSLISLLEPENLTSASKAETLIVVLSEKISQYGFVFALLAGLIIAGILASTMSTADSQLVAAASSVSEDILPHTFHKKPSKESSMRIARITLIGISLISMIIAWNPESSIFSIVSFAWAGFGAVFGPVMLLSLYWKRCTKTAAVCGMIAGGIMVFVWKYLVRPLGGAFDLYELAPAFLVSVLVIVTVSLLSKAPDESIEREFEEVKGL